MSATTSNLYRRTNVAKCCDDVKSHLVNIYRYRAALRRRGNDAIDADINTVRWTGETRALNLKGVIG